MMRILVLDDQPSRVDWLREVLPQAEVEHVYAPWFFLDAKRNESWDLFVIDHDLELHAMGYGEVEPTGRIASRALGPGDQAIVWTTNDIGWEMQKEALANGAWALWVPFDSPDFLEAQLRTLHDAIARTKSAVPKTK